MPGRQSKLNPPTLRKRRIFFAITAITPLILLAGMEFSLRYFHYGPNLSLFVTERIGGKEYHILNQDVKGRYFSRVEFTPNTSNDMFLMPKPDRTFRIFCLGGSTTVGFPYGFAGSFSTFLRDRLKKTFPEKSIEVINLGMTATNSFTVNDIAHELLSYQPDLFIVYDGHNEFYGALGIASLETLGGARWMVKAYLQIVHLRLFHLMRNALRSVGAMFGGSDRHVDSGTMMERLALGQYVPYGSPMYSRALKNFTDNLEELKDVSEGHGIAVILGTQVSNLSDLRPFVSNFAQATLQSSRDSSLRDMAVGEQCLQQNEFDSAASNFKRALSHDSLVADAHFFLAKSLRTHGKNREVRNHYVKARDFDELRFRASTDFNNAIRNMENKGTCFVADIEYTFAALSKDSIVGKELILEHLHPNLFGYFLMAKEYAHVMRKQSLIAPSEEWTARDTIADTMFWNNRSVTELDERAAARRIEILTSGWPFKSASTPLALISPSDTLGQIVQSLLSGEISWEEAHVRAAEFYTSKKDLKKAQSEYRAIVNQIPVSNSARLRLAQLFLADRKLDEARRELLESLNIEKTFYACKQLGAISLDQSKPQEAVVYLDDAIRLGENTQQRSDAGYLLALAHFRQSQFERAERALNEVLNINPGFAPARDLLNRIKQSR